MPAGSCRGSRPRVSRPRPSFSCETCRQRKLRCGREKPKCSTCQRMGEACEYSPDPHRDRSAAVKASKPPPSHNVQQDKRVSIITDGHPVLDGGLQKQPHTGYLGVGDPSTPHYVESTFWAFVNSQVSIRTLRALSVAHAIIGVVL